MNMHGHWQSRPEGGGRFALWLIRTIALHGGRRVGRLCLYPITLYFFLRRGPERRASRQYLRRAFGRPATAWQVLKHIHCFAATILDRIFLLAHGERPFQIETEGLDLLDERIAQGRGVLLLGSHQGSFEALRAIGARRPQMALRVVLDKQKTPAMTELLEALAPDVGACVIDAAQDGTTIALAMAEACADGAVVAMLADRGRGHEVLRRTGLLGAPAPFPVSPWLLAHTLRVPVVLCFGLYLGGNRYRLVFEPFSDRVEIPRHDRGPVLDVLIARYAQRLEHYIHVAPYNWFNFYDFWQEAPAASEPAAEPAAAVGERVGV
ncbi:MULTISPECIES: acyltransferase [Rhodanobacter]|uniref:Putative acyltransferase n=1 Tax=Rhodanobacter denitrificans TaxID=666685 RepID=M4NIQ0_9GAMM|nr:MULTISPECIES: acyltransferase [Rhodanobacter]AGG90825.1 putative acyltransferase [Rhodanobacter denitrificans]KZC20929.1 acyltransferase [Rhodanobacter denitrificans]UJJ50907.1 acyltransferase [Rhodanobacter denitrificans]UJJ56896.1 acyltransferase [Rhodanobacter denitrificans]UJM86196.1 acyltransferase [Rhodanobacter denitrificans]